MSFFLNNACYFNAFSSHFQHLMKELAESLNGDIKTTKQLLQRSILFHNFAKEYARRNFRRNLIWRSNNTEIIYIKYDPKRNFEVNQVK